MTMDYSPWVEREIWPFLKVAISPKPDEVTPTIIGVHACDTPTKIGVHACDINPYLHDFFEPISID